MFCNWQVIIPICILLHKMLFRNPLCYVSKWASTNISSNCMVSNVPMKISGFWLCGRDDGVGMDWEIEKENG